MLRRCRAFTLVEILIVVIILGILAAIVISRYTHTVEDAAATTTFSELMKIRRHIGVYRARNGDSLPDVVEGNGTWGQIVGNGEYLLSPPVNSYVGGAASQAIILRDTPDADFTTDYGWIFDPDSGEVWAAGFDSEDHPLPRP